MSHLKIKTFLEALTVVQSAPQQVKKYLVDKRLSLNEKKIIQSWIDLKSCLHEKIFQDLTSLNCENELIECQRQLILGLARNNIADFKESIKWLKSAFAILEKYPLKEHQFICIYNQFIVAFNLSDSKEIEDSFSLLETIQKMGINHRQEICFKQCKFNYHNFFENFDQSLEILQELEELKDEMSEAVIMSHQISKFIFHLKQEKFEECQSNLKEMKDNRLFRFSPNYKFMKMTLDHLQHNKPLYVYEKDFGESPYLFRQLKTIQALEESKTEEAQKYWKLLKEMDPEIYLENFTYAGQKNLFSLCLEKHKKIVKTEEEIKITGNNPGDVLINILKMIKAPIPKENLFEKIWGHKPNSTADDNRLKNLIYYVKSTKNIKISYRKGCYQLTEINDEAA